MGFLVPIRQRDGQLHRGDLSPEAPAPPRPASRPRAIRAIGLFALAGAFAMSAACSGSGNAPNLFGGSSQDVQATPTPTAAPLHPDNDFGPTPPPTPFRKPTPTPVPAPTIPSSYWLWQVCSGHPLSGSPAYSGAVHPLVVAEVDYSGTWTASLYDFPINNNWYNGKWTKPLQLVVCVGAEKNIKVRSCGRYTRSSDGKVGYIYTYKQSLTVKVMFAKTGKALQSKTFYGSAPACTQWMTIDSTPPPWKVTGSYPSTSAINNWATGVSTQKIK